MAPSKRLTILQNLKAMFGAVVAAEPVDDPFDFAWDRKVIGPLVAGDFKKAYSIGFVVTKEVKKHKYPFLDCTLSVAIEFQAILQSSNPASSGEFAENILTAIQRVIMADPKIGMPDTIIMVTETGNEVDLDSFQDKGVAGVLFLEIVYRHSHTDVRS